MSQTLSDRLTPSWQRLQPRLSELANHFYARLFELDPSVRALFATTDFSQQELKFTASIGRIVDLVGQPERLLPFAAEMGRRHVGYGVADAHYETVGNALLWALDELADNQLTVDDRQAWHEAYALVSAVMRRASMMTTGEARAVFGRPSTPVPRVD